MLPYVKGQTFQTQCCRRRKLSTPHQMSKHTTAPASDALRGSLKKGAMPQP